MKNTIILVSILLANYLSFAQTDQINQQKYWKLRDDLREDFVKISINPGGSIVARALKPNYCWNNLDSFDPNTFSMGEMHFGDGMIRQGYYLGLLATEYKLLKDAGQDTRGVLNELYYALMAINRNDYQAEIEQSPIYGLIQSGSFNGFYMREDIPEDFAKDNWGNSNNRMNCVNSPHFNTNNAAKLNQTATPDHPVVLYASPNSYQNVPSMDQLSSLMVGFQLVRQLVDNVYVQPTSSDEGKYVITETQAIVNRIMTYLNEHNWMMIDVNGWPVNNGGGDCIWAAYPLYYAALSITGNHYNTDWTRRTESFYLSNLQYCVTGFGTSSNTSEGQENACDFVDIAGGLYGFADKQELMQGVPPGPGNNQSHSAYQEWLASGTMHGGADMFADFWNNPIGYMADYPSNLMIGFHIPTTIIDIVDIATDDSGTDSGNFGILSSNLAAASGLWSAASMHHITSQTGNIELDLVNAVLKSESPYESQTYYKNYLDEMGMEGPYNFPQSESLSKGAANGWASEHRWTFSNVENGGGAKGVSTGIFNGMDYMLFHNLYLLAFPSNQPLFTPESSEECYCGDPVLYSDPSAPNQEEIGFLNGKLAHVHTCTENVFDIVSNQVTGNFLIAPYFPEYSDMGIFINKFETENAAVEPTGYVDVRTPLILCNNSTLNIKTNGVLKINQKHMSVNAGSTIDLSGELYVQGGTQLRVKTGANLIIRPGGKLVLHEDCKVIIEPGATLTYYAGAKIYTKNETGILEIKGNLNLQENATFNIDHSLSTISGCLLFTGNPVINAKPGAKFYLDSKGKTDPILALSANTLVKFSDPDIVEVRLENCGVDLSQNQFQHSF